MFRFKKLFLIISLFTSHLLIAQQADWCLTDEIREQQFQENPELREQAEEYEQQILEFTREYSGNESTRNAQFIIPVVFHVIHDNCRNDVSKEQIEDAMRILNEDFRRLNSDTSNTRSIFKDYAADSQIEFRLARRDPDGNCTDGITRINAPEYTNDVRQEPKSLIQWPNDQYLNIWLVNSIQTSGNGNVLGFAQFPGNGPDGWGIVQRHDRTGTIGTASGVDGRTLTHEVGHCFNLFHTFQRSHGFSDGCGGNCSNTGDRVCDTPPSEKATFQCDFSQNSCSNDLQGPSPFSQDMPDQVENYMSYDQSGCQNMFSKGQKTRMIAALNNIPFLTNLTSQNNLVQTGVINYNTDICQAEFGIQGREFCDDTVYQVCVGEPVDFINESYDDPVQSSWEFEGGSPSQSSVENPSVVYTEPGIYNVSLTIDNGAGISTATTKKGMIRVVSESGRGTPAFYDFDLKGTLLDDGWVAQRYTSGFGWERTFDESFSSYSSIKMNNHEFPSGTADLITESFDLTTITNARLEFKTAFSAFNNSNDELRVDFATECSDNWVNQYSISGDDLTSLPGGSAPISGLNEGEWMDHTINISNTYLTQGLRIRIRFIGDGGNDLYLDNFRIRGNIAVQVPTLNSPYNGEQDVSRTPILDWNPALASGYDVEWDTSPDFDSQDKGSQSISISSNNSNTEDTEHFILTPLDAHTTYYWRVRGTTSSQNYEWSEVYSFTTGDQVSSTENPVSDQPTIKVYPNPAKENITVEHELNSGTLEIFNISGALMEQHQLNNKINKQINISGFTPGVYLFKIVSETGNPEVKRIIISK